MDIEKQNQVYIEQTLNPILEDLVVSILKSKPLDPVNFMIDWLQSNASRFQKKKNAYGEDSEESEEDEVEEVPVVIKKKVNFGGRKSVSAEAFGKFNKQGQFKPRVIQKSKQAEQRIREKLEHSFMFSSLEQKDKDTVVAAFQEKSFEAGDSIIKQGDDGDCLYVVDSGKLECHKVFVEGNPPTFLKNYGPGDAFGELALLYNAPRAASITAVSDCVLFELDRGTFNHIVKAASQKRRDAYEKFLEKIELLEGMDPYERAKIAEALRPMTFKKGEFIVQQGDVGDCFFFLEEGLAYAAKQMSPEKQPEIVYRYKVGDYFGELALLKDTTRAASIVADTDCKLVALDRMSFKRLLGPLEVILTRNQSKYQKFMN